MTRSLGALTSPELARRAPVLAVPLGATEQHGPHLPLGTDTAIATALCHRLAAAVADVLVAPAVPYGSSGEHAGFPGTVSIGQEAVELLVVELVRSLDDVAAAVLVNAHGGNRAPLHRAEQRLRSEGRPLLVWSPTGPADDSHAGHTETSVMLHLHPDQVSPERAETGATAPLPDLIEPLRNHGVRAVSSNGVLGDPTRATAAAGRRILDDWTASLTAAVGTFRATPLGG
ncbi:mycofactocin biosynthesis peptidyl-dipeptidase MftE [Saccharopolyspora sp. HNM0983]|uniref:Mycofactocin biosynthesis peptidyl-dipeptidase MftE n=1 Tax=Saccharopolyspora montiporae TaxID=2781240 RepID=A0A929G0E2_9PSEU|nr:mycofactocin biosynthesis peptidyl-dipeptidase MftE [Saccharopolyspora sp. HNM0983]MBE9375515.1 mycofactocin biosynthesis peptidyl-dipeptidase MftE [Saccharopolyspora sp. HNM0983]